MFEFDQIDARATAAKLTAPAGSIDYAAGITHRAFLLWSEHCIECAAPECYQTCDLFKARPDERCRRFDNGTLRNRAFNGSTGRAAEIVFGQWGKLEARGNAVLFPRRAVNALEHILSALAPVSNLVGKTVRRMGGSLQWASLTFELLEMLSRRLHKHSATSRRPHGFLIEVYNPDNQPCHLKFECAVFRSKVPKQGAAPLPVWERFSLEPGYNRFFLDYSVLSAVMESGLPYKLSLTPEALEGTQLVFISLDLVAGPTYERDTATASSNSRNQLAQIPVSSEACKPAAKCVVFDLDNTLWDGVLLEGDVELRAGVKQLFETLDQRGILLTVASKNNAEDALEKLRQLGLFDYLVYPVINWAQKSANIQQLARKISIGTDTLIFVDDNPFEREEVLRAVSGIEVLPDTAIATLANHPRLVGGTTTESANRRSMYQQQIEREDALAEFGEDYLAFLRECRIVVSISPSEQQHQARVAELMQRTNQLNFSGTKYTREAIAQLLADDTTDKHIIHCKDKYGDYGVVGFSLTSTDGQVIRVHDFMLSCRVQGKLIEKAFFNYLANNYLKGDGILEVNFKPTPRNALAKQVLEKIGFELRSDKAATLQVTPGSLAVNFMEIL